MQAKLIRRERGIGDENGNGYVNENGNGNGYVYVNGYENGERDVSSPRHSALWIFPALGFRIEHIIGWFFIVF